MLLDKNPYVNAVTGTHTPLSAATGRGMIGLVKELIHRGADVHRRHKTAHPFQQALEYAIEEGSL